MVRAFYEYSTGRDLVQALADEEYVRAGQAVFGHLAAPGFEFLLVRGEGGEQGVYPGTDGLIAGMREWLESFRSYVTAVDDIVDLGGRVIVFTAERGVSRTGEVPISQHGAVIWSFLGPKVSRVETYMQRSTALEALTPAERTRLK